MVNIDVVFNLLKIAVNTKPRRQKRGSTIEKFERRKNDHKTYACN